ncbi:hypothetical protein SLE2022_376660 [Rubroshorea leprosula]
MVLTSMGNNAPRKYDKIDVALEERAYDITINITTMKFKIDNRHYGHMDCLGHGNYFKNMISGAAYMDGVILVFSSVDGSMLQTKEHILLVKEPSA